MIKDKDASLPCVFIPKIENEITNETISMINPSQLNIKNMTFQPISLVKKVLVFQLGLFCLQ